MPIKTYDMHPPGSDRNSEWIYFGLGVICLKEGKYEDALREFRRVFRINPFYDGGNASLARICRNPENPEEALGVFQKALEADPSDAAHLLMGMIHKVSGNPEQAIGHFEAAVRLNPMNRWFRRELGTLYHAEQRYEDAIREFQKSLEFHPSDIDTHICLGLAFRSAGQIENALDIFRSGIVIDVTSVLLKIEEGITLLKLGRYEEALDSFRSAIAIDPENIRARIQAVHTLKRMGLTEEALAAFRSAAAMAPEDARLKNIGKNLEAAVQPEIQKSRNLKAAVRPKIRKGRNLAKQGRLSDALDIFRSLVVMEPENIRARICQAVTLRELGRLDKEMLEEAIREFRDMLKDDPSRVGIRVHLGVSYRLQGKHEDAIREFGKAIRQRQYMPAAHIQLAWTYRIQARPDLAKLHLKTASESKKANELSCLLLGLLHGEEQEYEDATRKFHKALDINPGYDPAARELIRIYKIQGKPEQAEELECSAGLTPGHQRLYFELGLLRLEDQQYDAAAREFLNTLEVNPLHDAAYHHLGRLYRALLSP